MQLHLMTQNLQTLKYNLQNIFQFAVYIYLPRLHLSHKNQYFDHNHLQIHSMKIRRLPQLYTRVLMRTFGTSQCMR